MNSQPTICGVALDMDGLLFDTEQIYWDVGDRMLIRRGYRFDSVLQRRMMGRVGVAAIEQMIDHHQLDESPTELLEESDALFSERLADGIEAMPGLEAWIDFLKETRTPFGLATSSRRKFVDIILASVSWRDDLRFTLTGDDVIHGKPDPEMYLMASEKLSIPPSRMLVLEDSDNGCQAAVAAGGVTVAIPSQHTQDHSFDGAFLVANSLTDPRLWRLVRATTEA